MGLKTRIARLHYVWSWRIRYWWMDKPQGRLAERILCFVAASIVLVQFVRMVLRCIGG